MEMEEATPFTLLGLKEQGEDPASQAVLGVMDRTDNRSLLVGKLVVWAMRITFRVISWALTLVSAVWALALAAEWVRQWSPLKWDLLVTQVLHYLQHH